MRIGIVDFSKRPKKNDSLQEALKILGNDIFVVHHADDWFNIVKSSRIKHWIMTGSAYDVFGNKSPQIDTRITQLVNKRFLLICYSMESFLLQMGCKLSRRERTKETFMLNDNGALFNAWRNHNTFIPTDGLQPGIRLLAEYKNETMTAKYKNILMTQWHPEKTDDGIIFLSNWLS
jgi:GMP synthase-like glutamine amidotransferase